MSTSQLHDARALPTTSQAAKAASESTDKYPTIPPLPPSGEIPSLPAISITRILDVLFEPSPALHSLSLPMLEKTPFATYDVLIDAVRGQLRGLAKAPEDSGSGVAGQGGYATMLTSILASHPRLGEGGQGGVEVSDLSKGEQAGLNVEGSEAEELKDLNKKYEETFGGLKYVVFVNGRGRPEIMEDMKARIDKGDLEAEQHAAIQAMADIAKDRASKLV